MCSQNREETEYSWNDLVSSGFIEYVDTEVRQSAAQHLVLDMQTHILARMPADLQAYMQFSLFHGVVLTMPASASSLV